MWVIRSVVVDDALDERACHGQGWKWYQAVPRRKAGRITAAGMTKEVTVEPADGGVTDRVDDAYREKYAGSRETWGSVTGAFTAGMFFLPEGEVGKTPAGAFQRCGGPS